jgi:hypothetical protein
MIALHAQHSAAVTAGTPCTCGCGLNEQVFPTGTAVKHRVFFNVSGVIVDGPGIVVRHSNGDIRDGYEAGEWVVA